eukprot:Sdes_comp19518_c0_seq2m11092
MFRCFEGPSQPFDNRIIQAELRSIFSTLDQLQAEFSQQQLLFLSSDVFSFLKSPPSKNDTEKVDKNLSHDENDIVGLEEAKIKDDPMEITTNIQPSSNSTPNSFELLLDQIKEDTDLLRLEKQRVIKNCQAAAREIVLTDPVFSLP